MFNNNKVFIKSTKYKKFYCLNLVNKFVNQSSFLPLSVRLYLVNIIFLRNYKNFCNLTGRHKGVVSRWGLSRLSIRYLFSLNLTSGWKVSSW